ncbi:unnamed protein product [Angiostrongylus costaricensis]|uniref:protein-serine/threonine phosphatase n=1 Tax=Angiostrongylus costaricensis TaxID=334426 RepID=A0A0R3PMS1_ANGCS|nr:unnamed protein product [Angiostrongylus costaricensis]
MPIACLISQQILCMHGGLSPNIHTIGEIAALRKPIVTRHKQDRHIDFLWSDPHIDVWTFELSLIVRGHQPPMSGYERIGKHLVTIFSTPAYRIEENVGNMGASLVIDKDGTMDIIRMQVGEQLKLKRQRYKMDKVLTVQLEV